MAEQTTTPPADAPKAPESDGKSETTTPVDGGQKTDAPQDAQTNSVDLHGFTTEDLADMRKFLDNNGGWDKVKSRISNPPKVAPTETVQATDTQPALAAPQAPVEPTKPAEGYYSQNELGFNRYMSDLASSKKYAPIREYMEKDGGKELFDDLKSFNIESMDKDGNINVKGITRWLDIKLQTVPANQGVVEPSSTPTADYVNVGDEIKSYEDAKKVLLQNEELRAKGMAEHPATAKAKEFVKNFLSGSQK